MKKTPAHKGPITCLFTDIEDSTDLSDVPHPQTWQDVLAQHNRIVSECIRQHEGTVDSTKGDSFFAVFASTENALRCAVAMQRALHDNGKPLLTVPVKGDARPVKVRIGVYMVTQEVMPTEETGYSGRQVSVAQRFMDSGYGTQIVVSEEAHRMAGHVFAGMWHAWEQRVVKNRPEPITLYELLWSGASLGKIRAPLWVADWFRRAEDSFVGRTEYLQKIEPQLRTGKRLALLHGEGGIGKTRLALETARALDAWFGGRVFGVSFDRLAEPNPENVTATTVAGEIALALRAPEDVRNAANANSLLAHLRQRFYDLPLLLVLDNFESANNGETRALLGELLANVPNLRCLVTCREQFGLTGYAYPIEVTGLPIPRQPADRLEAFTGYQLFCERAMACDPPPFLDDTNSLRRILRHTAGSPLGIELTAARCTDHSLKRIADGLEQSLLEWQRTATEFDTRPGAARHESIEACIFWSYRLLPPDEQEGYARLGCFPADFADDAAQQIAAARPTMLLHWSRLHLLQRDKETERSVLSPVLRQFTARRLQEDFPQAHAGLEQRFVAYYRAQAAANWKMRGEAQSRALRRERLNFHAAAQWATRIPQTPQDADDLIWFGLALNALPIGDRAANVQRAIACYEAALRVYQEADFPQDWAGTQNNLGNAYSALPGGDRAANVQRAIACYEAALRVYQEADFPQQWAQTQNNLGTAYSALPGGDRAANVQRAIACFEAALRVYQEAGFPQQWAMTQNNLGAAYSDLPGGDRAANVQRAIACYEAALRVYQEADFPQQWAMTQNNLGAAYSDLPGGDRAANVQRAIACFEAALRVYQEADFPQDWAMTQNNLGTAYRALPGGDRAANVQRAIACYEAALRVYQEAGFPQQWAMTQNNLGAAYRALPGGDRAANVQRAIACYEAALRVYQEADFPIEYGHSQVCLGNAYADLDETERAREHFRWAVQGYAAARLPSEWEWRAYAERRLREL